MAAAPIQDAMSLSNFLAALCRLYETMPDKHELAIGRSVPHGLFYHKIEPDLAISVGDIRRWAREPWELRGNTGQQAA